MKTFGVKVPIVGYCYVQVKADDKAQAKEKGMEISCDLNNENVECLEIYGVEKVVEGRICYHPQVKLEVEEIEE